ncbi:hypothetical protein PSTG_19445, partial [Puccinia striiformis f. sp. tritici PST-78]
ERLNSGARSQSEDNDWQRIGDNESFNVNYIVASSSSANGSLYNTAAAAAGSINMTAGVKPEMNYEQLSKDLKAHVEQEQQNNPAASRSNFSELNTVTLVDLPNDTAENATAVSANSTTGRNTTSATTSDFINNEKRAVPVYHA